MGSCLMLRSYYSNREKYALTLHTTIGSLAPAPPFDFDKSLDFLGFFAPMGGEQTLAARAFAKAVLLHEQIVVFEIAVSGSIEQPRLAYTLHSDQPIRAAYLQAISAAFAGTDEAWLRAAPYAEVEAWLRAIKGLGAWSTTFVLLRGLGRMEQLPVGEARLAEAAAKIYGRAVPDTEPAAIAERYGAYQGYWAHYLRVGA